MAPDEKPSLTRHRSWFVAAALVVCVVVFSLLFGHSKHVGGDQPKVAFGAQVQQLGAASDLVYTNGWVATGGKHVIGVYAGSQRSNRRNGLFVILRQRGNGSDQKITRVVVPGSGAVTMLRPTEPATESAAFQTAIRFITANGGTGTLDLSSGKVTHTG